MPVTLPVRDRILTHLKERFEAVEEGVDDHVITWNTVVRRVLSDSEQQTGDALAIIDGPERKIEEIGHIRCSLQVFTEFWVRLKLGDEPSERLNLVMSDIYRTMRSDINSVVTIVPPCELTLNITEQRNEFDIEGAGDDLVGGVVVWEVLYRHKPLDSTKLQGEA